MNLTRVAVGNMLQNRFRVSLTVVAIAVSMFTFVIINTVLAAWRGSEELAVRYRVVGYGAVSSQLPVSYIEAIRATPHVKAATYAVYFDGKDPARPSAFFASAAVDAATFNDVFPDIQVPPDQLKAWKEDRRGLLIGDLLSQSMGWKIGDKVTLESPVFPQTEKAPWTFTVRAIFTSTTRSISRKYLYFHFSYWNEGVDVWNQNTFQWYTALVDDARSSPEVIAAVDKNFEEKESPTQSMDEETFRTNFFAGAKAIQTALQLVSFMLLGLTLLILGNTISMGVYERTRQYGALRALGFLPRHLAGFIMTESALTGLVGGALGCGAAWALIQGVLKKFVQDEMPNFFPDFSISVLSVLFALLLALALGLLASFPPALRAARMPVVDALRHVG